MMLVEKLRVFVIGVGLMWGSADVLAAVTCAGDELSGIAPTPNVDFNTTIQPIFNTRCAGCHTGGAQLGNLNLDRPNAVQHLVGVHSDNAFAGIPRVTPGDPDQSFLFKKVNCTNLNSNLGVRMPFRDVSVPFNNFLSPAEQALIRDWIAQGAQAFVTVPPVTTLGAGFSGNWFDPDAGQDGHGFQIEVLPDNGMLVIWFVFNPAGTAQSWIYSQGSYDPASNTVTLPAFLETGGRFPPNFNSTALTRTPWGSLTLAFSDCSNGNVTWASNPDSAAAGYGDVSFPIRRVTSVAGTTCP